MLVLLAACSAGEIEEFSQEYSISRTGVLNVHSSAGPIEITASSAAATILVEATLTGADRVEMTVEEESGNLTITVVATGGFSGFKRAATVDLRITVPENTAIDISSGDGDVLVSGAGGRLKITSGNGTVSVIGHTGEVDATTTNGDLSITGGSGFVRAVSGNGSVTVDTAFDVGSENTISTGNGEVSVTFRGELNVLIDAEAENGRVHSDLPIRVSGDFDATHLVGRIGDGDTTVRIKSGNGEIRLQTAE